MESRERKTGATMWQQLQPTRREPWKLLDRRQMVGTGTGSEGIFHADYEVLVLVWVLEAINLTIQMSSCGSQRCRWEDSG